MSDKVYKSAFDWWLKILVFLPWIGIAAVWWQALFLEAGVLWVAIAATALMVFVFGGLVFPMRYVIAGDGLHVRAGLLLRLFVPWDRIDGAHFTSNPLSSPALSLRRIHIDYRKANGKSTYVLISPTDRVGFLNDLAAVSGRHRLDGERLVRG